MTAPRALRAASIIALSIWPTLNFLSVNATALAQSPGSLAAVLEITAAIAVLGIALLAIAEYRNAGGAFCFWWVAFILVFFGYGGIHAWSQDALNAVSLAWPPSAVYLVLVGVVVCAAWRFAARPRVQKGAIVFSLILTTLAAFQCVVAYSAVTVSLDGLSGSRPKAGGAVAQAGHNNIYYVILDGYAGRLAMEKVLHFDNSDFLNEMARQGFMDAGATPSNYLMTTQTLGAIFALDYDVNPTDLRTLYPDILEHRPELAIVLARHGYALWQAASIWSGCNGEYLACMSEEHGLQSNYVTQSFLMASLVGRPMMYVLRQRRAALSTILANQAGPLARRKPFFVFAHQLSPHPPYVVDRACQPRMPDEPSWNVWGEEGKSHYVDAVRCLNRTVSDFTARIIAADPDAIIVLQSDHGSAFSIHWEKPIRLWRKDEIAERTSFLNLIRVPRSCRRWLRGGLGQVNTARFVVACATSQPPRYLPEKTFLSSYDPAQEATIVVAH